MTLSAEQIKDANISYHDAAADEYDAKWGIDYGDLGKTQVAMKTDKVLGKGAHFPRALEIGTGTGYLSLNMMQNGVIDEVVCTDISQGMLDVVEASAERLGFADRVTSERGDKIARYPKQIGHRLSPLWRRALKVGQLSQREAEAVAAGQRSQEYIDGHSVEHLVDVHAFRPGDLSGFAKTAGFSSVDVIGEELTANWFGWFNRALEADGIPEDIPWNWRQYAYRGYLGFQKFDRAALEGRLPASIFYNLMIGAVKPGA
jgi:hypothetical protein